MVVVARSLQIHTRISLDVRTQQGSLDRVSQSVNVEVSGEFKLQGGTLVAAINKENKRKNLTT